MKGWRDLGRRVAFPRWLPLAVLVVAFAAFLAGSPLRTNPYFSMGKLVINGQGPRLDAREVRDWLGVDQDTSMWDVSPNTVASRLRAHPLVAWAEVRREFPDKLEIRLREREPAALVLLDDLFYVDRTGALFGPPGSSDSIDYPVITGIDEQSPAGYRRWAIRRALRLLRMCDRVTCAAGGVSEVHVDREAGAILYPAVPRVPIVLGWGSMREKLRRADVVLQRWGVGAERLARVDTRFLGRVIVELAAEADLSTGDGRRGGTRSAGDVGRV